jgi:hypothetical protein
MPEAATAEMQLCRSRSSQEGLFAPCGEIRLQATFDILYLDLIIGRYSAGLGGYVVG